MATALAQELLDLDVHDLVDGPSYEISAFITDRADDTNFYFRAEAPECESD